MASNINIVNADDFFGNLLEDRKLHNPAEGSEARWYWPEEIGNGFVSMIKLGPGLALGIGNYQLVENLSVSFELNLSHLFVIAFTSIGCINCKIYNGNGSEILWKLKPGCGFVGYQPKWFGAARYPVGMPVHAIGIYLDISLLSRFMQGHENQFAPQICDVMVNGDLAKPFFEDLTMTPSVCLLIQQILNCPYQFPLKRLYLESKVLELIMYGIESFSRPTSTLQDMPSLKSDDIERVREAKNILLTHLENPPCLLNLARQVGINKNKLNQGFRLIYGTSVFDYLRILRLEKAKELLESKEKSVTQIALDVGYAHQRNFTRAFKNHFGTTPKDHLR